MNYIVRRDFTDMQDGGHKYSTGDEFPRAGYAPDPIRIAELSSSSNRIGEPLIEEKKYILTKEPEDKPEVISEDKPEEKPRRTRKKAEPKE